MGFSLRLTDVADEEVRKAIAAPLVRFTQLLVVATLPDFPKGFSRYFMRKELGKGLHHEPSAS